MTIRKFNTEDKEAVMHVCIALADQQWQDNELFREALLDVYCRYYVEEEPEHCFVVADDQNRAVGYILCAADFEQFEKVFEQRYRTSSNPVTKAMGQATVDSLREYAAEYPAHLHIDLLPETQGQGMGRRLIESLCELLKEENVPGLMLDVSRDNIGARAFYEKVGFSVLREGEQEILMGMQLS